MQDDQNMPQIFYNRVKSPESKPSVSRFRFKLSDTATTLYLAFSRTFCKAEALCFAQRRKAWRGNAIRAILRITTNKKRAKYLKRKDYL